MKTARDLIDAGGELSEREANRSVDEEESLGRIRNSVSEERGNTGTGPFAGSFVVLNAA